MSETANEAKYEINYLGGEYRVFESGFGWAASFKRESDARRFVAGEKAIEALKEIKAEIESLFASDIMLALEDTVLQGLLETAISALPAEETK